MPNSKNHVLKTSKQRWSASEDGKKSTKEFSLKNFRQSVYFINQVSEVFIRAGAIPSLRCFVNKVVVEIPTDDPKIKDPAIHTLTDEIDKIFEAGFLSSRK